MDEIIRIPWGKILANFVWIFGASLMLADFSYHEFLANKEKAPLIQVLKKSSFKTLFYLGLILTATGACFSIKNPWMAGGAALLLLFFSLKKLKKKP